MLLKGLFLLLKLFGLELSPSPPGFSLSSAMPAAPNPMFLTSRPVSMGTSERRTHHDLIFLQKPYRRRDEIRGSAFIDITYTNTNVC